MSQTASNHSGEAPTPKGSNPTRNLYVSHVPEGMMDEELEEVFGAYGEVLYAKVMIYLQTLKTVGHAFVLMATQDGADRAIAGLHGKLLDYHSAHAPLEVAYSEKDCSHLQRQLKHVFARNIPRTAKAEDICELVGRFGEIEQLSLTPMSENANAQGVMIVFRDAGKPAELCEKFLHRKEHEFPGGIKATLVAKRGEELKDRVRRKITEARKDTGSRPAFRPRNHGGKVFHDNNLLDSNHPDQNDSRSGSDGSSGHNQSGSGASRTQRHQRQQQQRQQSLNPHAQNFSNQHQQQPGFTPMMMFPQAQQQQHMMIPQHHQPTMMMMMMPHQSHASMHQQQQGQPPLLPTPTSQPTSMMMMPPTQNPQQPQPQMLTPVMMLMNPATGMVMPMPSNTQGGTQVPFPHHHHYQHQHQQQQMVMVPAAHPAHTTMMMSSNGAQPQPFMQPCYMMPQPQHQQQGFVHVNVQPQSNSGAQKLQRAEKAE